jgi:hypothetical protein
VEFNCGVDCGKHGGLLKFFSSGLTIETGGANVASAAGTLRIEILVGFLNRLTVEQSAHAIIA